MLNDGAIFQCVCVWGGGGGEAFDINPQFQAKKIATKQTSAGQSDQSSMLPYAYAKVLMFLQAHN